MVSVIIPIYNSERFLVQCLDSVLNQTLTEIEVICVDDGSSDKSWSILEHYVTKDPRIRILKQENQGAGKARNLGLSIAIGEFVHFFDSDDFLILDAYEKMYKAMKKSNVDILIAKAYTIDFSKEDALIKDGAYELKKINPSDFNRQLNFSTETRALLNHVQPWRGISNREFLEKHQIRYDHLKCGNDRSFYAKALIYSKSAILFPEYILYHRVGNPNSLVGIRAQHYECLFECYYIIEKEIKDNFKSLGNAHYLLLFEELKGVRAWIKRLEFPPLQREQVDKEFDEFLQSVYEENLALKYLASGEETQRKLKKASRSLELQQKKVREKETEIFVLNDSISYRLGRIITFIPRKLRNVFRHLKRFF